MKFTYADGIREAFEYLLGRYPEVFVIGQGLWSPWYVGNTMTDLDLKFGKDRVMDTPVSEAACTAAAIGASLNGMRPIVIHPRIDFMILAIDPIVNQAAKWSHMLGGQAHPAVTIRGIINRGGQQGAQHSQALHSWFSHIPGLRLVMPYSPTDARDLLISAVLSDDPVIYLDDRWLYEETESRSPIVERPLSKERPRVICEGKDLSLVGCGFSTHLAMSTAQKLESDYGISAEVIDLRILNPFHRETLVASVQKTGRLAVIDGGWKTCGLSAEVISSVGENLDPVLWKSKPLRITLPDAPAPTSKPLEEIYYPTTESIVSKIHREFFLTRKIERDGLHAEATY